MENAPTDTASSGPSPRFSLELEGERVLLRPHRPEDAPRAFELLHRVEPILDWLTWGGPRSVEELAGYYADGWLRTENGDEYRLAVVERSSGELAGSVALRFVGHPEVGDVGYWIGRPYQGRGLGSEALTLTAHLGFHHLRARALSAWVFDGNERSRRMLERNGFVHVRSRWVDLDDGRRRREHHLSAVAEDWRHRFESWRPLREEVSELGP